MTFDSFSQLSVKFIAIHLNIGAMNKNYIFIS